MIVRMLVLVAALTGAAGLSQFPEFSQQYMQRLGGAVDELGRQVMRYEADAAGAGLTIDSYLSALAEEGEKAQTQAANIAGDIARYDRLKSALEMLEGAGPFMRARLAFEEMPDQEVAARAFEVYKPAVPATFEGAIFAATGFLAGWMTLALAFAILKETWRLLTLPFRRRRPAR